MHGTMSLKPNQHLTIQSYKPVPVEQLIHIFMSKKFSTSFYPQIFKSVFGG